MPSFDLVVDVMPLPEILDPAGQAVLNALPSLGLPRATVLRIGKRIELTVDAPDSDDALRQATAMAQTLLANPVIEDFRVTLV